MTLITEIKAQEYINQNLETAQETVISHGSLRLFENQKLTGELIIQDYPNLEQISLPNHQINSLRVENCPNLQQIILRNNQLVKLEIKGKNQLKELIASKNELTDLDLSDCLKLKELIVCDNLYLGEIKGLDLATLKNINITNTGVDLSQEIEELKRKNKSLAEIIKKIDEGGEKKALFLTETIQTPKQADEAILRHLQETEKRWRDWLINPENALPSFQIPAKKSKAKEILKWVIAAQTDGNYWDLVQKWSENQWNSDILQKKGLVNYDAEAVYDYDNSLYTLLQYLGNRDKISQKN